MNTLNIKRRDGEGLLPDPATLPPDGGDQFNRLIFASSPYLLQHARNPVDWYPWCDEAFEKAVREDKPVFLSIGYSTCHWCHVMEHESFEDADVARLLNEHFVAIKVDREERPDIDHIYMEVCQATTGSGGWPLSVFITPDKKPFFAGTYFPKEQRYGRPGFVELLQAFHAMWHNDRGRILEAGKEILGLLAKEQEESVQKLSVSALGRAVAGYKQSYDNVYGGFGRAPKFPMAHALSFLLREHHRTRDDELSAMVEHTLIEMYRGGMYDHVGFGFCRYSTDRSWLVPHFEKMLYDNALLILAYVDAYQLTGKAQYRTIAKQIIAYILRDMTDAEHGFYSAENADSEGEEGKFYVFTHDEFSSIAGPGHAEKAAEYFGITKSGNFEHGNNILHISVDIGEWAMKHGFSDIEAESVISGVRERLFAARSARIHPSLDDKVLTSWNGLMIAALSRAGQAFSDGELTAAAVRAAEFLLKNMMKTGGGLYHRWRKGSAGIDGFLEDYAFLVWGLIELYEATFDSKYLQQAVSLNARMMQDFHDEKHGGFFLTAHDAEQLPVRPKDAYDGAIPSGNSVAAYNMIRLARLTGSAEMEASARKAMDSSAAYVSSAPTGAVVMLMALNFAEGPSKEIVLAGDSPEAVQELAMAVRTRFLPTKTMLFAGEKPGGQFMRDLVPYASNYTAVDGKPTAYVCENFQCKAPVNTVEELILLIDNG